jgi:hypothetical protein
MLSVPTESDWGDYNSDLDQKWGHDHYAGKNHQQVAGRFRENPVEGAEDLRWMPEVPFRYYFLGFLDVVLSFEGDISDALHCSEAPNAASCFLGLVEEKLKGNPSHILPIMPDILASIEHIAFYQANFDADPKIYGSFPERLLRIRSLLDAIRTESK